MSASNEIAFFVKVLTFFGRQISHVVSVFVAVYRTQEPPAIDRNTFKGEKPKHIVMKRRPGLMHEVVPKSAIDASVTLINVANECSN